MAAKEQIEICIYFGNNFDPSLPNVGQAITLAHSLFKDKPATRKIFLARTPPVSTKLETDFQKLAKETSIFRASRTLLREATSDFNGFYFREFCMIDDLKALGPDFDILLESHNSEKTAGFLAELEKEQKDHLENASKEIFQTTGSLNQAVDEYALAQVKTAVVLQYRRKRLPEVILENVTRSQMSRKPLAMFVQTDRFLMEPIIKPLEKELIRRLGDKRFLLRLATFEPYFPSLAEESLNCIELPNSATRKDIPQIEQFDKLTSLKSMAEELLWTWVSSLGMPYEQQFELIEKIRQDSNESSISQFLGGLRGTSPRDRSNMLKQLKALLTPILGEKEVCDLLRKEEEVYQVFRQRYPIKAEATLKPLKPEWDWKETLLQYSLDPKTRV